MSTLNTLIIRHLGQEDYKTTWQAMQQFTHERTATTHDEIWLLEHPPVFTQGQNGKPEHILAAGDIPVIQVDRGGQVTYHGPGQLIAYTLIDINRKKLNVREIVTVLEKSVINLLHDFNIPAESRCKAPGVYTEQKKICSIGLRIRKGTTFHGLALNVKMNLEPFTRIHPCGFSDLTMTQISEFKTEISMSQVKAKLIEHLMINLGYNNPQSYSEPWYGTKNAS